MSEFSSAAEALKLLEDAMSLVELRITAPSRLNPRADDHFDRLIPAYVLAFKHFTCISYFGVQTFTFYHSTFIICANPQLQWLTASFLWPTAVLAVSSGSRLRLNLFPESDYSGPPVEPAQTINTRSGDRAAHSGRWHTWFQTCSGP